VPKVVGMPYAEGKALVEAEGFDVRVDNQTVTTNGLHCAKIAETTPQGGTKYDITKPVKMVVIDGTCPGPTGSSSPTGSPR
jgi:beta-lactam-binding protein with PASTA domain